MDDTTEPTSLADLLRSERERLGLSLGQLERRSGINRSNLHRMEGGIITQPSAETLNRLAAALGIEVEVLYDAAWKATDETLPSLPTYFRSKYQLSDDQIAAVQQAFDQATKPAPAEPPKRGRPGRS